MFGEENLLEMSIQIEPKNDVKYVYVLQMIIGIGDSNIIKIRQKYLRCDLRILWPAFTSSVDEIINPHAICLFCCSLSIPKASFEFGPRHLQ
jgi:hypothetical protein